MTIKITLIPALIDSDRKRLLAEAQTLANKGLPVHITDVFRVLPEPVETQVLLRGARNGPFRIKVHLPADSVKPENSTTAGWIQQEKIKEEWWVAPSGRSRFSAPLLNSLSENSHDS